jgi:hypothetical protein
MEKYESSAEPQLPLCPQMSITPLLFLCALCAYVVEKNYEG